MSDLPSIGPSFYPVYPTEPAVTPQPAGRPEPNAAPNPAVASDAAAAPEIPSGTSSAEPELEPGGDPARSAGPGAPAADGDDGVVSADESFQDDMVGAGIKLAESARGRIANDRRSAESRRRLANWQKVRELSSSTTDGHEDEARRRLGRLAHGSTTQRALTSVEPDAGIGGGSTLEKSEAKVKELMSEIGTLLEQIEAAGGLAALSASEQAIRQSEGVVTNTAKLLALAGQLQEAQAEVRNVLALLLTGGSGLRVLRDPSLTFRRLFAEIERWPACVPPGRQPQAHDDYDRFISWVFAPPPLPEDLDLSW